MSRKGEPILTLDLETERRPSSLKKTIAQLQRSNGELWSSDPSKPVNFIEAIVCYVAKQDVISEYKLRLAQVCLSAQGSDCQLMFRAIEARSSTGYLWKELIDSGFPFVKAELFRNAVSGFDTDECLRLMSAEGFNIRLVESSLADLEPADSEPPEPDITPPTHQPDRGKLAWRSHIPRRGQ